MIRYISITCEKCKQLANAQQKTCLRNQHVDVLSDIDQLDVDLRMCSISRKTLRWWDSMLDFNDEFYMFIDDDTWVFTENVERVCKQLDPNKLFMVVKGCFPGGCPKVANDVFGINTGMALKAKEFRRVPVISYHAGAGILMTRAMAKMVRAALITDEWYVDALRILNNVKDISVGAEALWPFTLSQDLLMPKAFTLVGSMAEKRLGGKFKEYVKEIKASSVIKNDIENDHPWCTIGTGIPARINQHISKHLTHQKSVTDLNPTYPVTVTGDLDVRKAWELANIHYETGLQKTHVVNGANLLTFHKFKTEKMFKDMQQLV